MLNPIGGALERLNRRLPLAARQSALPPELAAAHRFVLRCLFDRGRPPEPAELAPLVSGFTVEEALARLGSDDLVVLSPDRSRILGAYPMTGEPTPHLVLRDGRSVYAMCAIDALSISPMFGGEVEIRSSCRVARSPVAIRQRGKSILSAGPEGVLAGVRWDCGSGGPAAHSLCMEMVFLRDAEAALEWHGGDLENHTVLALEDAVEFGSRFFCPLVSRPVTVASYAFGSSKPLR